MTELSPTRTIALLSSYLMTHLLLFMKRPHGGFGLTLAATIDIEFLGRRIVTGIQCLCPLFSLTDKMTLLT